MLFQNVKVCILSADSLTYLVPYSEAVTEQHYSRDELAMCSILNSLATTDIDECLLEYRTAYQGNLGSQVLLDAYEVQQQVGIGANRLLTEPFSHVSAAYASELWKHLSDLNTVNCLHSILLRESHKTQMLAYALAWSWLDIVFEEVWKNFHFNGLSTDSSGFMLAIHDVITHVNLRPDNNRTTLELQRQSYLGQSSGGVNPLCTLSFGRFYVDEKKQYAQALQLTRQLATEWLGFPGHEEDLLRYDLIRTLNNYVPPSVFLLTTTWEVFQSPVNTILSKSGRQNLRRGTDPMLYIYKLQNILSTHSLADPKMTGYCGLEHLDDMVTAFQMTVKLSGNLRYRPTQALFQPLQMVCVQSIQRKLDRISDILYSRLSIQQQLHHLALVTYMSYHIYDTLLSFLLYHHQLQSIHQTQFWQELLQNLTITFHFEILLFLHPAKLLWRLLQAAHFSHELDSSASLLTVPSSMVRNGQRPQHTSSRTLMISSAIRLSCKSLTHFSRTSLHMVQQIDTGQLASSKSCMKDAKNGRSSSVFLRTEQERKCMDT